MDERLQIFQDKMEKSLANLNEEFAGIRAGRANPHVLDKLRVDYYGTPSPIQSVANVSVPEPRMIQIQPWEASMVKEIEKAILSSDLGINPTNDGKLIRLVFPELTEERRKELAKDIKKKGEGAKLHRLTRLWMPSRMKFLQYKMFKGHKPVAMSLFHLQERGEQD